MGDVIRTRALVSGTVQGVGFRYRAQEQARRLGIAGYVRNLPDGSVEAEAEGPADVVASFVQWLREGPAWADVDGVETTDLLPTGDSGFDLRH